MEIHPEDTLGQKMYVACYSYWIGKLQTKQSAITDWNTLSQLKRKRDSNLLSSFIKDFLLKTQHAEEIKLHIFPFITHLEYSLQKREKRERKKEVETKGSQSCKLWGFPRLMKKAPFL